MVFRDAPLVVWGATLLHIVIGALVLLSPVAGNSTGPAAVVDLLGRNVAGGAMLLASALAMTAMTIRQGENWTKAGLLLPQQALLYVAAWGGLHAVIEGQYADGVMRPYEFILTDQLLIMLFAILHTLALIELPWNDT